MSDVQNENESCPSAFDGLDSGQINPELRRRSTMLAAAAAALLAVGGVVAVLGLGAGAQLVSSPNAWATTVRATPPSPRPHYTAQAPTAPGELRSRNPGQARAESAMAWFDAAKPPFNSIQDALQTAAEAAQASNVDGVRSACEQLRAGSRRLGNTLPSPDKGLTDEIQAAVDELTVASDICLAPNATSNYQEVLSHVTAANSHFAAAQQIIEGAG